MVRGIIYIATNKMNGKRYVGQTIEGLDVRIARHLRSKKNLHFGNALSKYGADAFDFQQIVYSRGGLNYWEKYFILILNTMYPTGYNHTTGGDTFEMSDVAKQRISKALKGRPKPPASPELCKRRSEIMMGNKYSLGVEVSLEARRKRSVALKGRVSAFLGKHHTEEEKRRRSIYAKEHGYGKWMLGKKCKPCSDETKALISQRAIERWAQRRVGA